MSTEIYYLSGTGNSLYVAKELQKRIQDTKLIPIARLKNEKAIETSGEVVGFVFPIHFMTAPSIVMNTLKKLDLKSAQYVFVIATRYGTPCSVMFKKIEKILKAKDKNLNAYLVVNMANNDPKFKDWKAATTEEIESFQSELHKTLDSFTEKIIKKENHKENDSTITYPVSPLMERIGAIAIQITGDGKEEFYSDSKCTGCGICEKVCLSNKIKLINNRPQWQKDEKCFSCYACINYCPEQSIQIKSNKLMKFYTENNGRYSHPYGTAEDIAMEK